MFIRSKNAIKSTEGIKSVITDTPIDDENDDLSNTEQDCKGGIIDDE